MRLNLLCRGAAAATALLFVLPMAPAAAHLARPATATGSCTATVNGIDITGLSATDPSDAIEVGQNDSILAAVTAPGPIGHYQVQLAFAGFHRTVAEADTTGDGWSATLAVRDYATYGVGLYQVHLVSSGVTPCEGAVLIRVTGSPLGSIGGWAALAFAAAGVGATAMAATRRRSKVPVGSMALGVVGGAGVLGIGQEFAYAFPTRLAAIVTLAAGAAVPLVAQQLARLVRPRHAAPSLHAADTQHQGASLATAAPQHQGTPLASAASQHGAATLDGAAGQHTGPSLQGPLAQGAHTPPATNAAAFGAGIAATGWLADTIIGAAWLPSWTGPEPEALPSQPLEPGLGVRFIGRSADRIEVECSNGRRTWVDAVAIGQQPQ